jgi:mRNA-degrading endonuclease RelE of RelBE toxin-antitoxin system
MNTAALWEVRLGASARKSLEAIPAADRARIEAALKEMAVNPFQGDIKALRGAEKSFRRRVGAWRIFFFRIQNERRISVTAIERRTSITY